MTVQGTTIGMISDIDGNFSLDVPVGKSLLFSYVGYMPQTVKIGNNKIINVTMQEDSKTLEEIVIVGYGTQKKVNLTGAISSIDSKVLESRPLTNLGQGLQGLIPNLQITNNGGGRPGSTSSYNVRGYTSLSGGGPLVLVDGVQMDPNQINPSDVESVTVLKDASSAAIYGGRAAYGVVLITTKKGKKNAPMRFNYSYDYSITRPTRLPDLVNSLQFVDMYRAAAESGRLSEDLPEAKPIRIWTSRRSKITWRTRLWRMQFMSTRTIRTNIDIAGTRTGQTVSYTHLTLPTILRV